MLAVLVVALSVGFLASPKRSATTAGLDESLIMRVKALEDEVRQKELALSVQEKRLKEMEERPTLAAAPPRQSLETPAAESKSDPQEKGEGPLLSLPEEKAEASAEPRAEGELQRRASLDETSRTETGESTAAASPQSSEAPRRQPIVNFNAQSVTVTPEGPNSGTLSFRLVKDHPEVPFRGYLFVFLEMVDGRNESKIWAYPDRARLGEEYLPSDFRQGHSLSFKANSRVELPYRDGRSGASLARVSILLYGPDGNIVFQRGFERKEVKTGIAKGGTEESAPGRGGRRRAL